LSSTFGSVSRESFSEFLNNIEFPNAKEIKLPRYLDCGNFLKAKDRIIPVISVTDDMLGSRVRLHFVKAEYDGQVKMEIVWEKEIGRNLGSEIKIVKFEASRTHTYLAYEVNQKSCQKIF